jgi:hypothetical protein
MNTPIIIIIFATLAIVSSASAQSVHIDYDEAGTGEHNKKWYERQASRYAKKYFGPSVWTPMIEFYYPTY